MSEPNKIPTPRTDAATQYYEVNPWSGFKFVRVEKSQEIERELSAALKEQTRLRDVIIEDSYKIAQLTKERDVYRSRAEELERAMRGVAGRTGEIWTMQELLEAINLAKGETK